MIILMKKVLPVAILALVATLVAMSLVPVSARALFTYNSTITAEQREQLLNAPSIPVYNSPITKEARASALEGASAPTAQAVTPEKPNGSLDKQKRIAELKAQIAVLQAELDELEK